MDKRLNDEDLADFARRIAFRSRGALEAKDRGWVYLPSFEAEVTAEALSILKSVVQHEREQPAPAVALPPRSETLANIRLAAARGRSFGHQATVQPMARMVERKDRALDEVLKFCADAGEVASILRAETPTPEQAGAEPTK